MLMMIHVLVIGACIVNCIHPLLILRIPFEEMTIERKIADHLSTIGYAQTTEELKGGINSLWKTIRENSNDAVHNDVFMNDEQESKEPIIDQTQDIKLLKSLTGIVIRSMRSVNPQDGDVNHERSMLFSHSRLPQQIHPYMPLNLECSLPSHKINTLVEELQSGPLDDLIKNFNDKLSQKSDIDFVIGEIKYKIPFVTEHISETDRYWDNKILELAHHLFWFEALYLHDIGHMILSHAIVESLPHISHLQASVTGLRRLLYYATMTKPSLCNNLLQDEIKRRLILHEEAFAQDSAHRHMMLDMPPRLIMAPTAEQTAVRNESIDIILAKRTAQQQEDFPSITNQQNSLGWNFIAESFWTQRHWGKSDTHIRRALEILESSAQTTISTVQQSYPKQIPSDVQLYYDEGILVRALCRAALEVPRHRIPLVVPRIYDEIQSYPCNGDMNQCKSMIRSSFFGSLIPTPSHPFIIPSVLTSIMVAQKNGYIRNASDILRSLKIPLMALLRLCMLEQQDNTRTIKRIVALWRLIHMAAEGEKKLGNNALTPEQFPRYIASGFIRRK